MRENFTRALGVTLQHEGGWADHPRDPGGATNKGITLDTYRRYRPGATKEDLRRISDAEVARIYRRGYWDEVKGDQLPSGVDLATFDAGVNSGPRRGAKWLQKALGRAYDAPIDGWVGPLTLGALRAVPAKAVIQRLCDARLGFVRSLSTWDVFGKGWSRRIGEIRATALAWAGESPSQIRADAEAQEKRAGRDNGLAAGSGGGGGVVAAPGVDATSFDWSQLAVLGIGLGLIAIAVVFASRAKARKEIARTMREVARKIEGEVS